MTDLTWTKESVLAAVEKEGVGFIHLQFTDVVGIVKGITIPVGQLPGALESGVWFDGSSIQGFARIAESDMYLMPDPTTFAVIPWEGHSGRVAARLICDVYTPTFEPFAGDPRGVLKRVLAEARAMGYKCQMGPELEFFLFRAGEDGVTSPLPHDQGGYFDQSTDLAVEVRKDMVNALTAFGIQVEASHHEVATGQHEIDFQYADALRAADNSVTFKYALKAVAQLHGLYATFMPKPIMGINGSGMHTHQSLIDLETGENAFADPEDEYGLSELAKQYVAGQLAHARGMCAVLAPLVNSYKRLVPGYEAPVYVSWARINRSALIRVPRISTLEATRLELRCPDPSCNPYLAFAAMLKTGLEGIKQGMTPPEAAEENLYHLDMARVRARHMDVLPGSLAEALEELGKDTLVQDALGQHVYEQFVEAKSQEWDQYRLQVTPWEVGRYLPIY
jgi:glutamine synthetase